MILDRLTVVKDSLGGGGEEGGGEEGGGPLLKTLLTDLPFPPQREELDR